MRRRAREVVRQGVHHLERGALLVLVATRGPAVDERVDGLAPLVPPARNLPAAHVVVQRKHRGRGGGDAVRAGGVRAESHARQNAHPPRVVRRHRVAPAEGSAQHHVGPHARARPLERVAVRVVAESKLGDARDAVAHPTEHRVARNPHEEPLQNLASAHKVPGESLVVGGELVLPAHNQRVRRAHVVVHGHATLRVDVRVHPAEPQHHHVAEKVGALHVLWQGLVRLKVLWELRRDKVPAGSIVIKADFIIRIELPPALHQWFQLPRDSIRLESLVDYLGDEFDLVVWVISPPQHVTLYKQASFRVQHFRLKIIVHELGQTLMATGHP
mmetsp:Transcript_17070/g.32686  ORF Transcript_17070/g.32686 Transcript_17070/m.32686 type:complete len:329 (-) Transcript_17070:1048-2034(-)